jgi:23S rRNA G2069 N7-methylase RlmK/C1962 C5-methylase RlmI
MDAKTQAQAEMLANRVRKAHRKLFPLFEKRSIGAFRLYDRDIPEIRAAIDWYEGHLVVAEYAREQTAGAPGWLPAMAEAAGRALEVPPGRVHLKTRRTRPQQGPRYASAGSPGERLAVREGPLRFWVELDAHIDTGLFADHRETRARVRAEAQGKAVLNLFGYTGSFTCAAAHGGARATATVDASRTYLDWAAENLALNSLQGAQHELIRADARQWMERAAREGRRFDLCVLDPPSFSTREGAPSFDVQRDHPALIEQALALLSPAGVLYFSTNHQRFEPRLSGLRAASVREITAETVPVDYRNSQAHRCFRIVA